MKEYFIDVLRYHYFDFKGRATRKQYWLFFLWNIIAIIAIMGIALIISRAVGISDRVSAVVSGLLSFLLIIPEVAIFVRRVRDVGHNPYWGLLMIPRLIAPILSILCILGIDALFPVFMTVLKYRFWCGILILICALLPTDYIRNKKLKKQNIDKGSVK